MNRSFVRHIVRLTTVIAAGALFSVSVAPGHSVESREIFSEDATNYGPDVVPVTLPFDVIALVDERTANVDVVVPGFDRPGVGGQDLPVGLTFRQALSGTGTSSQSSDSGWAWSGSFLDIREGEVKGVFFSHGAPYRPDPNVISGLADYHGDAAFVDLRGFLCDQWVCGHLPARDGVREETTAAFALVHPDRNVYEFFTEWGAPLATIDTSGNRVDWLYASTDNRLTTIVDSANGRTEVKTQGNSTYLTTSDGQNMWFNVVHSGHEIPDLYHIVVPGAGDVYAGLDARRWAGLLDFTHLPDLEKNGRIEWQQATVDGKTIRFPGVIEVVNESGAVELRRTWKATDGGDGKVIRETYDSAL